MKLVSSAASCAALFILLAACGPAPRPAAPPAAPPAASAPGPDRAALAALGRQAFFDPSLSASGRQSCASCHSPANAYGPPDGLSTQPGGERMDRQGLRSVPSLRYTMARTPRWSKEYQRDPIERAIEIDTAPMGGFARDGRFDTLHEQARAPLFDPLEMANRDDAALAAKLRAAPYASEFARVLGTAALADDARAVAGLTSALERFELDDPSFAPFSSRFDRYLKGQVPLSPQELRGMAAFVDPQKGNCASCHRVQAGADGSPPLFTDFSFSALGVPRNARLAANADPRFFDEGLCGPLRKPDAVWKEKFCGQFKTPTLRNVAARQTLMHNGVFHDLASAVRFYAERDIHPERWYPRGANGRVDRFDDLPPGHRANVDQLTPPMDRKPGDKPALDDGDVADIVAFLGTLTDADVAPAGHAH